MTDWVRTMIVDRLAFLAFRMGRRVFLLPLLMAGVAAQQPTFHSQANLVLVPTLVKSGDGRLVYGLEAKDFVVEDDGLEQVVQLDEDAEREPVSLVVAIQRGRRASYEFPRIQGLGAMLDPLMSEGLTQVAIVEFDSVVELKQDFTTNAGLIRQELKRLQAEMGVPPFSTPCIFRRNCWIKFPPTASEFCCWSVRPAITAALGRGSSTRW